MYRSFQLPFFLPVSFADEFELLGGVCDQFALLVASKPSDRVASSDMRIYWINGLASRRIVDLPYLSNI